MEYKAIIEIIEKPISGEWGIEPSTGPVIKVLRNTNFSNDGNLDLKDVVEREIPFAKIEQKKLQYGDILIEKSGGSPAQPVGRVVFFDQSEGEYLFSNFTSSLRPQKGIFPKYLFYILYSNHLFKKTLSYQNKTTGILNLQLDRYLKETKIHVPKLSEQQRIATILDYADSIRRKNQQILEKYDELAQSVFFEMFGDPVCNSKKWDQDPLFKLGKLISGGTPSRKVPKYFTGNIPWITTTALGKKFIGKNDANELITSEAVDNSATKLVPKGSIMIGARIGVGKASILSCDMCSSQDILSLTNISNCVNKIYLLDVLRYFEQYFKSQRRGATIQGITSGTIKNISIPIPPITLQKNYSELIENIENQKELIQISLGKSTDLFQCLLQMAFKGEL